jgi:hypothetical protein
MILNIYMEVTAYWLDDFSMSRIFLWLSGSKVHPSSYSVCFLQRSGLTDPVNAFEGLGFLQLLLVILSLVWGPPSLLSNGYQGLFPWG